MSNGYEMGVRRGEIHWVKIKNKEAVGSEMQNCRPALVVSNNKCNEHSPVIEVVYMTTAPKKDLPTHAYIDSTSNGRCEGSTVLCEQIQSISVERLRENSYIARVTDEVMELVDEALMVSLGLDDYIPGEDEQPDENRDESIYDKPDEIEDDYVEYDDGELEETIEKLKMAEMERDFYKKQYDSMMERIMAKANI